MEDKKNPTVKENIVISAKNIYKSFGPLIAVNDLSFDIEESDCFGFLGPNGAGKTTMMKILYGKAVRDKNPPGSLSVFGYDPQRDELRIKTMAGVVPQEDNLDSELDVLDNLRIYSKFYHIPKKTAMSRIEELLDFMELTDKKKSRIRELSGGMKRRLVIVRALLNQPRLLVLDEPTTGLDPQMRQLIWDKLRRLKKDGVTILLTTHYMEEAFQICDKIIIMHKGCKVIEGQPGNLIKENIEKYALQVMNKRSIGCLNEFLEVGKVRKEESDEMAVFYSREMSTLEKMAECLNEGDFYIRQSNLEDVFLKITGRGLNEE